MQIPVTTVVIPTTVITACLLLVSILYCSSGSSIKNLSVQVHLLGDLLISIGTDLKELLLWYSPSILPSFRRSSNIC